MFSFNVLITVPHWACSLVLLHVCTLILILILILIYNIYVYIYISVKMAAPWGSLTLLSFHSLCLYLRSHLQLTKWDVFQNKYS